MARTYIKQLCIHVVFLYTSFLFLHNLLQTLKIRWEQRILLVVWIGVPDFIGSHVVYVGRWVEELLLRASF